MTHPLFRQDIFTETAFARRFQAMLRSAWHNHSWHVIVADPGAGKTMSIRDLLKTTGSRTILAVVAPKNTEDEQALGDQFYTALGLPLRGQWRTRKPKFMGHLHQYGTECLIVDDAHDLSLEHLMLLKEVTDQGRLQYDHPLGPCLVAAARGNTIPLKETLDQPDPTWLQWRRRLDKLEPFCRVTMDNLMKLVIAALQWSYEAKATDVQDEWLERAAELLVLRHDTLRIIDGAGPSVEADQASTAEPVQKSDTQAEQVSSANEAQRLPSSVPIEQATQVRSRKKALLQPAASVKCTFSGVVPIDLKRFEESGVAHVECPDCGRAWTLSPSGGVLRFKSHDKRKTNAPVTGVRWAMRETIWKVIGG
jgi:hypothetical protein